MPSPIATPPENNNETKQYAVYDALLKARFVHEGVKIIVIRRNAGLGRASSSNGWETYLRDNFPDMSDDMVKDFESKNQLAYELKPLFELGVDYTLISDEEIAQIFDQQNQDGWDVFYDRYPDSPGDITLSQVGFNEAGNKALVYYGNQQHWLAGVGYYAFLALQGDQWVIQDEVMAWVS